MKESSKGNVVLTMRNGELTTEENLNQEKCQLWDELKERAELCGLGHAEKCFIDWEKLVTAVEKMKAKMETAKNT